MHRYATTVSIVLLVLLVLPASQPTYADTSNGDAPLAAAVKTSNYSDCIAGDKPVTGSFIYARATQCSANLVTFQNGESREIGSSSSFGFAIDFAAQQNIVGFTSCLTNANAVWVRTFGEDEDALTNFIKWQMLWFPRKADNSLDSAARLQWGPYKLCTTAKQVAEGGGGGGEPGAGGDTPVVVDASGAGVKLSARAAGGWFDLDGDRTLESVPRLVNSTTGWLVWDVDEDGVVRDGRQLFGNHSLVERANGYEALRPFDDDGDGLISARDGIFPRLFIWYDDGDWVSETEELVPLGHVVQWLSLSYKENRRRDRHGNELRFHAACGPGKCSTVDIVFGGR